MFELFPGIINILKFRINILENFVVDKFSLLSCLVLKVRNSKHCMNKRKSGKYVTKLLLVNAFNNIIIYALQTQKPVEIFSNSGKWCISAKKIIWYTNSIKYKIN